MGFFLFNNLELKFWKPSIEILVLKYWVLFIQRENWGEEHPSLTDNVTLLWGRRIQNGRWGGQESAWLTRYKCAVPHLQLGDGLCLFVGVGSDSCHRDAVWILLVISSPCLYWFHVLSWFYSWGTLWYHFSFVFCFFFQVWWVFILQTFPLLGGMSCLNLQLSRPLPRVHHLFVFIVQQCENKNNYIIGSR